MLIEIERGRQSAGNWLASKGEGLNKFSMQTVELSRILEIRPKTLRILRCISIGEMALGIPALLMEEQISPTTRLALYTGSLVGVFYYLVLQPFPAHFKNIQISTHVLPLTARAFQAVGNRLAA